MASRMIRHTWARLLIGVLPLVSCRQSPSPPSGCAAEPLGAGTGAKSAYAYQQSDMCRPCHPRQVERWRRSMHARAHGEAVYNAYFIKASQDSGQRLETFCARCHTPLAVHHGAIPFKRPPRRQEDTTVSPVEREGVQCDFCHTITGYHALENGGYRLTPVRVMRGPLRDAHSPFHGVAFDEFVQSSAFCGTCHNVTHPRNGIVLESTFSEWKNSPYAKAGTRCQDCHMTAGLTRRQTTPGPAARPGPRRPHISDHFFVGPNLLFNTEQEAAPLRRLSLELLRRAASITIGDLSRTPQGKLQLSLRVHNRGAGHYLPTGVTELREMWLELTITDSQNQTRLHVGGLDAKGQIDPRAVIYRTEVADKSGRFTTRFWNTEKKLRDHRIPPQKSVTEHIALSALDNAPSGPLTVEAKLRYRSVSPFGLAEVNAPANLVTIPVITMAHSKRTLTLR